MEDILASIRRILAEDSAPVDGPPVEVAPSAIEARPNQPASPHDNEDEGKPEPMPRPPTAPLPSAKILAEKLLDTLPAAESRQDEPADAASEEDDVLLLSPDMRAMDHKLVSERVADDSTDVLSQLARAILDRRDIQVSSRDVTLEGMVREMLRPLLREWLDRNLPYLIERLVKKEIDLMINRAERLED